jgi:hypothetical protein
MLHKHWDPTSSTFLKLSSKLKEFVERADEVLQRKGKVKLPFRTTHMYMMRNNVI